MRLLLLLLIAIGTAIAAPFLVYGAQPDLLPGGGGDVLEALADLQEAGRLALDAWRKGEAPADPAWAEARVWRALAVLGVASAWFLGFLPGGVFGLALMNARPVTLAVLGAAITLALYSCTTVEVSHDLAPGTVKAIRRLAGLWLAAALAGFLTARSFRRTTI